MNGLNPNLTKASFIVGPFAQIETFVFLTTPLLSKLISTSPVGLTDGATNLVKL